MTGKGGGGEGADRGKVDWVGKMIAGAGMKVWRAPRGVVRAVENRTGVEGRYVFLFLSAFLSSLPLFSPSFSIRNWLLIVMLFCLGFTGGSVLVGLLSGGFLVGGCWVRFLS